MFYFRILRPDVTRLLFELRVDQVVVREDLVPLFLREHLLFVDDEFMQGLAGEEAFASDVRAGLIAEVGLENRDDAERAHHEVFAVLGVDNDAVNALFTQSVAGVRQNLHLHIQSEGDDRFHHVQFKLAGGGGKHDGGVETDGEERSLIRHFRDNRIDLARHDRAARLELGQNDFAKAGTRAGGQETQVIADLRELDGEALAGRREGDIGAAVGRGGDQVVAVDERDARQFSEALDSLGRVFRMAGNRRADGGGAEVHDLEVFLSFTDRLDFVADRGAPAVEFLSEGHRNGVLQVGTAHLEDILRLFCLLVEAGDEVLNGLHEDVGAKDQREVKSRRIRVVCRLAEVGVVVRGDLLVTLREAKVFASEVADNFVAVHVRGRAGTTLEPVSDELIVVLAGDELVAGPHERIGNISRDRAEFLVRERSGLLHISEGDGKERFLRHRHFRDVEILLAAHRLDAVVDVIRDLEGTKEVVFNTGHVYAPQYVLSEISAFGSAFIRFVLNLWIQSNF